MPAGAASRWSLVVGARMVSDTECSTRFDELIRTLDERREHGHGARTERCRRAVFRQHARVRVQPKGADLVRGVHGIGFKGHKAAGTHVLSMFKRFFKTRAKRRTTIVRATGGIRRQDAHRDLM